MGKVWSKIQWYEKRKRKLKKNQTDMFHKYFIQNEIFISQNKSTHDKGREVGCFKVAELIPKKYRILRHETKQFINKVRN